MAKPKSRKESEYSIAGVSKLTGVSCHALRVWERRYGFPIPNRSESGHRRYLISQVLTLKKIVELVNDGRSISEVIADLRLGKITVDAEPVDSQVGHKGDDGELIEFLDLALAGKLIAADLAFDRLKDRHSAEDLVTRIIAPAFTETGERWFRRRCDVYQEHCVTGYLRRKLDSMIESASTSNSVAIGLVLLGTVQGDRHEGGLLIANVLLELAGWRVINLGVDLPIVEFVKAVEQFKPDALALSFVLSRNVNKRFEELAVIKNIPVFVGGRSILNYQGLAKRHGLIPLTGSVRCAIEQMGRVLGSRVPGCANGHAQPSEEPL